MCVGRCLTGAAGEQVKNYFATENITDGLTREQIFKSALEMTEHGLALQELSNGGNPSYESTVRIVEHPGARTMADPGTFAKKHPGFQRNNLGGFFTS